MCCTDLHRIGIYGFGAAGQAFARSIGAVWAGSTEEMPPTQLGAALIFAPVGPLMRAAMASSSSN